MLFFFYVFNIITIHYASAKSKLIGGKKAQEGQFPYQVSIRNGCLHICGGAILNERWILTAAHCFKGTNPKDITVVTGTNTLLNGGDVYNIELVLTHKNFNYHPNQNDIALVKLDKNIKFTEKVKTINLPTEDIPNAGDYAVVSGWGSMFGNGRPQNDLEFIKLTVIDLKKCKTLLGFTRVPITHRNICMSNKRFKGACSGDSGGPLVYGDVIVGVVSWAVRPCGVDLPDVYSRVYAYRDWILDTMKTNA